jgi:hypothetical protein
MKALSILFGVAVATAALAQTDLVPYASNPVVNRGGGGTWDRGIVHAPRVVVDHGVYYLFYTGSEDLLGADASIGYATSTDGIAFTKYEGNPILSADGSGFDAHTLSECAPIVQGDTWVIYYNAHNVSRAGPGKYIGRATAPSPSGPWTRMDNPVLQAGSAGEWDSRLATPDGVFATDTGYVMYYSGSNGFPNQPWRIGMATSPDGITWTKYDDPATPDAPYALSDPIFAQGDAGTWDSASAANTAVLPGTDGWEMYYTGCVGSVEALQSVGYATGTDGLNWTRFDGNPVLTPTEAWGQVKVVAGSAVRVGTDYYLYYAGWSSNSNARIGLAISSTTSGRETPQLRPKTFALLQNHPNPFNSSTVIQFELPNAGPVLLRVFDVSGRNVMTLADEVMGAGTHQVGFEARTLPSGVYVYRLQSGEFAQSRKLVVLK